MPTYLVTQTVGKLSEEEIRAAMERGRRVREQQLPGVRWIRSYYSAEEGKLYCEYEAPDLDLLFEHAEKVGLAIDHATVVRDLEPSMFW